MKCVYWSIFSFFIISCGTAETHDVNGIKIDGAQYLDDGEEDIVAEPPVAISGSHLSSCSTLVNTSGKNEYTCDFSLYDEEEIDFFEDYSIVINGDEVPVVVSINQEGKIVIIFEVEDTFEFKPQELNVFRSEHISDLPPKHRKKLGPIDPVKIAEEEKLSPLDHEDKNEEGQRGETLPAPDEARLPENTDGLGAKPPLEEERRIPGEDELPKKIEREGPLPEKPEGEKLPEPEGKKLPEPEGKKLPEIIDDDILDSN